MRICAKKSKFLLIRLFQFANTPLLLLQDDGVASTVQQLGTCRRAAVLDRTYTGKPKRRELCEFNAA